MSAQQETILAHSLPSAMKTVIAAMKEDQDYAWSWHCNVAMAFVDAGGDHYTANQGAARFMRLLAGVEPTYELPAQQAEPDYKALYEKAAQQYNELAELIERKQASVAQQKPLTDEQINQMWSDAHNDTSTMSLIHVLARAIEAAHGIK